MAIIVLVAAWLPLPFFIGYAGMADPAAPAGFFLHDGDRVVMYGDSITDQKLYTVDTETYVTTRFPKLKVDWTAAGWGGDRISGGGGGPIDVRLDRDVLAYKPTVMTIMLGMNDGSYQAFNQGIYDTFTKGYQHIIDRVTAGSPGVRYTLIQPSPFDDVTRAPNFTDGYNSVLIKYGQFLTTLNLPGTPPSDFNTPMVAMLAKANATGPHAGAEDTAGPGASERGRTSGNGGGAVEDLERTVAGSVGGDRRVVEERNFLAERHGDQSGCWHDDRLGRARRQPADAVRSDGAPHHACSRVPPTSSPRSTRSPFRLQGSRRGLTI